MSAPPPHALPAGPLSGIVVADFSRVLAAPYATMLFGDLGADVIKVERPGTGDDTRAWGPPFAGEEATYFLSVNRNKRSLTADLSDPAARGELLELVRRADVLVENFRPGTMHKHGLGWPDVQEINSRLVYCSVTGFGAGKGAGLPGYDLLVQAVGGLMSVTGPGAGEPVKTGVALVDVLTGLHAAIGILAALRAREHTGRGQLVEVNLLTSLLSSMVNQAGGYTGPAPCREYSATGIRQSRPTKSSRPPTARSSSPSATTGSSPRSATASASPAWPPTRGSSPTRTASPTSISSPRSSRPGWRSAARASGSRC